MAAGSLRDALVASQRLGMLGRRPVEEVMDHAGAFVAALASTSGSVIDLGSGGGVPGLVIAIARPDLRLVLVDRRAGRTDHLQRLVRRLGIDDRVAVTCADAAHMELAAPADAVVARGFGPPRATAAVAARLLRDGGILVVSEPPGSAGDRWADLDGVEPVGSADARVAVLRRVPRGTAPGTA